MYTIKINRDSATFWRWLILRNGDIVSFGYEMSAYEAEETANAELLAMRATGR